jgi:putative ABC transport system ATP-binding protein
MSTHPGGLDVRCKEVVHIYRRGDTEVIALRSVDLEVAAGEMLAIYGPSGSGKSTLVALLGGLISPTAGQTWIGDQEISRMPGRRLLRLRAGTVATVLQGGGRNLLPYATAAENVAFAQRVTRRRAVPAPTDLLGELGLAHLAHRRVAALSGGEQQRVAVAAAVAAGPGLVLADEPTSQLDTEGRNEVLDLLHRVNQRFGSTIVVVTHDPVVGQRLGRTITMRFGRVGQAGVDGRQFTLIGRDGGLQLPDEHLEEWPPGTLVEVVRDGGDLRIRRRGTEDADGPADA